MHIAVAIVGFRNADLMLNCLRALQTSSWQDFEVIICENGGPAAYDDLLSVLPASLASGQKVRAVLAPSNGGYASGVNICLRETDAADAWWVLNPDTEPHADAMAIVAGRLAEADCEAVGCTLYLPDGRVQSHGGRWYPWLAHAVSIGLGDPLDKSVDPATIERKQNYLSGAAMLISRRFLEIAGPMREDYFLFAEEVEWCLRAIARGARLGFAKSALVLHRQGTSSGNIPRIAARPRLPVYLDERNRLLLTYDRYPLRMPVVAFTALATIFAKYPRRGAWRQLGYSLAGWWAGLTMRRGAPRWAAS